ncbi:hypothetical protein ACFOD7_04790 [Paracoccus fontiphilus]|uniref:Transposase n=1 Tax=Paracoccus fontiphilus TaxID=1815556 RepID=A0ABV7IFM1_9RHOB
MNDKEVEASVVVEYQVRLAARKRKLGQMTRELELAKETPQTRSANSSERSIVISGTVHQTGMQKP